MHVQCADDFEYEFLPNACTDTKNACFTQWVQVASRGPEWTVCPHGQVTQPKVSEEEPQFGGNGSVISGHGRVELIKKQKGLQLLLSTFTQSMNWR